MNIDNLTYHIETMSSMIENHNKLIETKNINPFEIGKAYFIRTITHIDIGIVDDIIGTHLILRDGAWIADTGRFYDCLKTGSLSKVEPFPETFGLNMETIVDWAHWNHPLPLVQK